MSVQATALQVVIMRDGLLVGTEVFVPGQYIVGSGPDADLHLDDATVGAHHAHLLFQNGKAAIQDGGAGGTFVNGHLVKRCELRPVDEIILGPFTLKVRVMTQKAAPAKAPPSALPPPPPVSPAPPPRQQTMHYARPVSPPATVVSNRRSSAAPQAQAPQNVTVPASARAPYLRPVPLDEGDSHTESVSLGEAFDPFAQRDETIDEPLSKASTYVPTGQAKAPAAPKSKVRFEPQVPAAPEGKGKPHLFVETYWGDTRHAARSFRRIDAKKHLVAREDDAAPLPLYGFPLEGKDFVFAEQHQALYRVYVPPGAIVERRAQDGKFYPVQAETLEQASDSRRCITLGAGHAVRFAGANDVTVLAYVQPSIPKPFTNPLKGLPWLMFAMLTLFMGGFGWFVYRFAEMPLEADFQSKTLSPVAVKLIAPPKPEEKQKLEKKIESLKKKDDKKAEVAKKVDREKPKEVVPVETKKALKSIEKLAAAGPAMKDLLAAVDKLGTGPGAKNAKNDFKLSGLIGKAPIANAGLGTFGLGGGGANGAGFKGAELLRGKGSAGIGALGAGNIGKGTVAGTVTRATSRSMGTQGAIDKEAVAKVINAHLHEVSSCYERALLKTPGLTGKIVLEWQITTAGGVGYAKTKSSTMQSPAVESCILTAIKAWRFPPAKGAGVVITYPFMFNSVGY